MAEFLLYIHQFRAVAIVFVIASHVYPTFDWSNAPLSLEFVAALFGNGTFLFVFIAGFIFQHLLYKYDTYKYDTRKYYKNKLTNVLLPYLIVGIPAVVVTLLRPEVPGTFPDGFQEWPALFQILWLYATGTMLLPLWFIPMISIIYLLAPLLVRGDQSGLIYKWLPLLFLLSLFIPRPFGNNNPIQAFLIYFPVYVLGMWCSKNAGWVISVVGRFRVPLAALWLGLLVAEIFWFSASGAMYTESIFIMHEDIISVSNIEKAVLCLFLVYLLYMVQHRIGAGLNLLADMSFALFFLHEYVVLAVRLALLLFDIDVSGNIPAYLAYTALVIAVTLGGALLVKHVLGERSRLVIGS